MKIFTRFGLCIIVILLLICLYIFSRRSDQEGMTTAPTTGPYKISRMDIDASDNYINERVLTLDTEGHVTETNLDTDILHKSSMNCIAPAAYNPSLRGCDCSAGYTYSTKLGCLAKCPLYQTYSEDMTGPTCTNICTDPNQYYNMTTQSCQFCPYGYQQDESNKCSILPSCPIGQGYNDHSGTCNSCPEGQTFNDSNECTNICLDYQEFNPLSETCDSRCKKYERFDESLRQCVPCPLGMVNNGKNQCIVQAECAAGQMFGNDAVCMSKCLEKWEIYDPTHDVCTQQCIGKNGAGQFNQYLDLVYDDQCHTCPDGQISNGMNGCMPGPPVPVPTCEPGYEMNHGKCVLTCAPWRVYNEMTDNCQLRCDKSQRWDTDTNLGCVNCPEGYTVDALNQCTVPIPKAPLVHVPRPTCPPGFIMDLDGSCTSVCQDYAVNNVDDPFLCDLKCQERNKIWSRATKGCITCGNGYLNDRDNKCNDCDRKVEYLNKELKYNIGTLNYSPVDDANELTRGYYCMPTCERGHVRVDEEQLPDFNTCHKCDVKPNRDLRVVKYVMENSTGRCLPICQFPNIRDSEGYDPAHPCPKCEYHFTQDINMPNNPNHLQVVSSTGQVTCMPDSCPIGYVIGINPTDKYDISCNACDIAGGYTNDIALSETKVPTVTYPPNDITMSGYKCFPKTCPDNTALGPDLKCSLCAVGFYGNPKQGCGSPEEKITIASITKVAIGKVALDETTVTIDGFTMDLTLKFEVRYYLFAKASINGSALQALTPSKSPFDWTKTTLSFPKLNIPDAGLQLTINYYDTADMKIITTSSTYTVKYEESTMSTSASTDYDVGDFAVGYILVGGGQAGSNPVTSGGLPNGCHTCPGNICPVGILVSYNNAGAGCKFGQTNEGALCRC